MARRRISIFGATGSVGQQTVGLIDTLGGAETFEVVALTGSGNIELLARQAMRLEAEVAVTAATGTAITRPPRARLKYISTGR